MCVWAWINDYYAGGKSSIFSSALAVLGAVGASAMHCPVVSRYELHWPSPPVIEWCRLLGRKWLPQLRYCSMRKLPAKWFGWVSELESLKWSSLFWVLFFIDGGDDVKLFSLSPPLLDCSTYQLNDKYNTVKIGLNKYSRLC